MTNAKPFSIILLLAALVWSGCSTANDLKDRAKDAAGQAVEREVAERTDATVAGAFDMTENAVRCLVGDQACIEEAKRAGKPVVVTDEEGTVVEEIPSDEGTASIEGPAPVEDANATDEDATSGGGTASGDGGDTWGAFPHLHGVYGNPSRPSGRAGRKFFVSETCGGQLAVGAMWGDVAPWILTRVSGDEYKWHRPLAPLAKRCACGCSLERMANQRAWPS